MSKKELKPNKANKWTKPELRRIGQIKDVAGPNGFGSQGSNNRS